MKYKHILVALELSEETNVLIDRAVFLAKLLNAEVSFVHIDGTHGEIYPELIDIKKSPGETPLGELKWNNSGPLIPIPIIQSSTS